MPKEKPTDSQSAAASENSLNHSAYPPAKESHHRGRWRRYRHREERNPEPLPECLNLQELKGLSLEEMQTRLEEMQISFKSKERHEIIQDALRFNAEKQGLSVA